MLPDGSSTVMEIAPADLQRQPLQHYFELRSTCDRGVGLFAIREVPLGLVLPYVAVAMPRRDFCNGVYFVSSTYTADADDWSQQKVVAGLQMNGDPRLPPLQRLPEGWCMAARINEATTAEELNCELAFNPVLTKADIEYSAAYGVPVIAAYMITTKKLCAGTQLLTVYGDADAETSSSSSSSDYAHLKRLHMPVDLLQWMTDLLTVMHSIPSQLHGNVQGRRPPYVTRHGAPPYTRAYYVVHDG